MLRLFSRNSLLIWISTLLLIGLNLAFAQSQANQHSLSFWLLQEYTHQQIAYDIDTGLTTVVSDVAQISSQFQSSPSGNRYFTQGICQETIERQFCLRLDNGIELAINDRFFGNDGSAFWLNERQILIQEFEEDSATTNIYLIDADTGEKQFVSHYEGYSFNAELSPNHDYLFLPDANPIMSLLLHIPNGEKQEIFFADNSYWSPNSRYLASYQRYPAEPNTVSSLFLNILDLETGEILSLREAETFGAFTPLETSLWSADSQEIAFLLRGEGRNGAIMAYNVTTAVIRTLYDAAYRNPLSWSPDGRYLLMEQTLGRRAPLEILDLQTGTVHEIPVENTRVEDGHYLWASDSTFLVLDYQPQGLRDYRRIVVFDSATGELLSQRDFFSQSLPQGTDTSLQWWE